MTGPAPAVAAVRRAVRAVVDDLPPDALVLAACSGGPDSTALAAGLAHVAARRTRRGVPLRAGLLHVDHGLDPASGERAAAAAALGERLGLAPVEVVRAEVGSVGGPEDAARRARYDALDAVAARLGAAAVLLGHTRDDQAETVLLRLARGSGARSLAGMPVARGLLRRPLLGLRRSVLREACAAEGLTWCDDPANADPSLARVRVRAAALPALVDALGEGVVESLARTADLLRADADHLEAEAAQLLAEARAAADGAGGDGADAAVVLAVATLAAAPPALRGRALRAAVLEAGAPAGAVGVRHVAAVEALVVAWRGQGAVALPGGVEVRRRSGTLLASPRHQEQRATVQPATAVPSGGVSDHPDVQRVLVTAEEIADRIAVLAESVAADHRARAGADDEPLLLVGILKGALMIMADLARALPVPVEVEFMAVSSYGSSTSSSGVVRILKDLDRDISGRHVLVVEDILDSGRTLSWLLKNLSARRPASLEVLTLLRKPAAAELEVPVRYSGFDLPPEFVVGYGLDYAERYRDLPYVGVLKPQVYATG